ncbi:MAG: tetratricopeptide repeat protein [Acetobacteraceae bacterium]
MLTDRYGLPVSTASAAARDAYVEGVDLLLAANDGPAEAFQRALEADPGCMLAHLGKARALQMRGDMAGARAALADAQGIAVPLTPREQSQRAVFALLIAGRLEPALEATRRHLADFPRDAMVLAPCATTLGLFGLSGRLGWQRSLADLMDALADDYGDDWWFTGMHAFALEETGQIALARSKIEHAMAQNPRFAHGAHIKAHVHYETGEAAAAMAYLRGWMPGYRKGAQLHRHLSWHIALFELLAGNADAAWQQFHENVHPQNAPGPALSVLCDGLSFLWRAELAGAPGDKAAWEAIRQVGRTAFPSPGNPFADVHVALADAMAGDLDSVSARIEAIEAQQAESPLASRPLTAALARGFSAYAQGDWTRAIEALEAGVAAHEPMGGSRAQRDLVEFTLLKAYLNAGRMADVARYRAWRRPGAVPPAVAGWAA